jgi:hypothetical protein
MTKSNENEEVVEINIDSSTPLLKIEEYVEFEIAEVECLPCEQIHFSNNKMFHLLLG